MAYELLIIAVLVMINGLFAGAEIAVLTLRPAQILQDSKRHRAGLAVQALRAQPERFLATVQIAITVVGAGAGAFGGVALAADLAPVLERAGLGRYSDEIAFAAVIAIVSWASLVFGELVPKSLALRYSRAYALLIARPLLLLSRIGAPLVWFLTLCSNLVLRVFGDRTNFMESRVSRDELREMVEHAAKDGAVHPETSEIAARALAFEDVRVAEIMVTRERIVALDRRAALPDIRRVILEEGHDRMPVYDGTLDHVVGYVIARDILILAWESQLLIFEDILRPPLTVQHDGRAVDVLREMQRRRTPIAIILDGDGKVAGLVTIEDLIEELVGDIFSEDDDEPIAAWGPDATAIVPGTAPVRLVNRALDIDLPVRPGRSTIAGVCLALAQDVPARGEQHTADDGTVLEVIDATPRRVRTVRVHRRLDHDEAVAPQK
jgi:putative hemolysin